VIGTNKKDAQETVDNHFADLEAEKVPEPELASDRGAIESLLREAGGFQGVVSSPPVLGVTRLALKRADLRPLGLRHRVGVAVRPSTRHPRASRGAASPLCRASSASLRRDLAHPRNSSLSSMSTSTDLGGFYIAHAVSRHESLLPMRKRYGKIAMVEDLTDRRQALEAAGLSE
jgi:hypothetical protein